MQLGSTHFSPPDPRSQADLIQRVDQLAQKVDQLLNHIYLAQNLSLGPLGEERRMDDHANRQIDECRAGRADMSRQGEGQQRDQLANMSQASSSHTQSNVRGRLGPRLDIRDRLGPQRNAPQRLGSQRGQPDNLHGEDDEEKRSAAHSRRTNSRRQATEDHSQAQSTNTQPRQRSREARTLRVNEEVNQRRPNSEGCQRVQPAMRAEDVKKLVNDQLRDLKAGGNFEDALRKEMDQANSTPFTVEIEHAAPPKRFSTPSFTPFKGDSDTESHLKHFKSVMILHKDDDALMCKVFVMTLRGAAQDWFHTLPSELISSFKELAYVFAKAYTSYRTIKKNPDHLFNLRKKSDESLRDYIKRFKAEKANIVGCNDQIASSAFKRGLPTECDLYRELTISPCQTLEEVFATAERYALWDDDRIAAKKVAKQADQSVEQASQRNGRINDKDGGKHGLQPLCYLFKNKFGRESWRFLLRQGLAFRGHNEFEDSSNQGNFLELLQFLVDHNEEVRAVALKNAPKNLKVTSPKIQKDIVNAAATTKEPPQKVIRINTILADSEESGLTSKEKKRKIKQAIVVSQVSIDLPPAEDDPVIGFQKKDLISLDMPHNDALVVSIQIA
ncbi:uncharacterized protein LOC110770985 [Prunus avium]|uniref:Uncharacterized protein LOC110770985 n=1 Tax=Prunus avium TaxID=42229 RepID=A0A6P5TVU0_PRUAV|nr:uncharacterized protein LOC110770985 [Prunus avium]